MKDGRIKKLRWEVALIPSPSPGLSQYTYSKCFAGRREPKNGLSSIISLHLFKYFAGRREQGTSA